MKRADRYFRINENTITLPGHLFVSNKLNPLERRRSGGEKGSREYLAAPYWGLEKRGRWEKNIFSMMPKEKEREYLTATYWG